MTLACLRPHARGTSLSVQAAPRASRSEIVDISGDRCKMRIKAAPVEGEANEALTAFIAKTFGITKRQVSLEHGAHGKQKTFVLAGITPETVEIILRRAVEESAPDKERA
ncbi:DUF167 domain-containing protein [Candidatus Ozemobacteraceae bacterium]|nr:DUF167 domain-containing protein [Candidatus Ozemobacteraceae bacterium]